MTRTQSKRLYAFGAFRLDADERVLFGESGVVPLTPKAFDTLLALVENSGHVLGKEELMKRVWPDSFVEENNLAQNISAVRKALGEDAGGRKYIETVPRRGYRFVAEVREGGWGADSAAAVGAGGDTVAAASQAAPPAGFELPLLHLGREQARGADFDPGLDFGRQPETMYARSGEVNIAYQVVGDAPLDLVFVMGWVSHMEYFWREPSFARFLRRLSSFSRLILFDKRGTGLSDRVPINRLPTLEQRMDDVRAVLDAVGSERAALCGVSEGGPMCSLFAATYPEKTSALVMLGTYAKRVRGGDYPWAPTPEERQHFFEEIRRDWGGPVGLEERAPSVASDPRFREWWATYLRMGASPGAALALTQMNAEIDVRHVLPSVRVPTLVIHRSEDQCLKVEEGRYVASRIPGARYVELPGRDHLPFVGDQDAILDEVEEFLTGARHTPEPDRVLATVLFTRIADSSEQRTAWPGVGLRQGLIQRLRAYVRKEIEWFRGREIDMVGDRPLAIFDGPARAVRCAYAIVEYASRLGVEMRAGLHTGECDVVDGQVTGVATEIGVQVANRAAPGEVLVSNTVKDLVAGSGINFEDRGAHRLGRVPGEWRLFGVRQLGRA
ncbi:MAG TPA: alpha/beta fold hydrolase [Pyrinomonadaceae bacterium]|jgi:pimeloyl-ACP methyl ester carboxylesterase/DNA-binding winged helix-turn-helix (wHTH) protein